MRVHLIAQRAQLGGLGGAAEPLATLLRHPRLADGEHGKVNRGPGHEQEIPAQRYIHQLQPAEPAGVQPTVSAGLRLCALARLRRDTVEHIARILAAPRAEIALLQFVPDPVLHRREQHLVDLRHGRRSRQGQHQRGGDLHADGAVLDEPQRQPHQQGDADPGKTDQRTPPQHRAVQVDPERLLHLVSENNAA